MKENVTRRNYLATADSTALAAEDGGAGWQICRRRCNKECENFFVVYRMNAAFIVLLALVLTFLAGCSKAPEPPAMKQSSAPIEAAPRTEHVAESLQVIAYYFHGTVRCETCLKIEKQARELIERQFQLEMFEKRLVFKPVNYDKPENAHFSKDYKLPCPSLVIVRQQAGQDEKWKLLDKTWDHIENPIKFNEYVEGCVKEMLGDAK
jgi:hypothetical protein